jgi:hypothetical protein
LAPNEKRSAKKDDGGQANDDRPGMPNQRSVKSDYLKEDLEREIHAQTTYEKP